jgi:YbbR domain-containing protein
MNRILKNIFVRNWGLKLFSFVLALVLWFAIIPEEKMSFEQTLTVPLELPHKPSWLEIAERPPATIEVTIKAPNRLYDLITSDSVRARLDLATASVEQSEYPITINMISLPQGAEVVQIFPSQVKMRMERSKEVLLDVEPSWVGQLPDTLVLVRWEVIPSQVSVTGPESRITETDQVRTSPIDLSSITGSIEKDVDVILPNSDLHLTSLGTQLIVRIIVREKTEEDPPAPKKKKESL